MNFLSLLGGAMSVLRLLEQQRVISRLPRWGLPLWIGAVALLAAAWFVGWWLRKKPWAIWAAIALFTVSVVLQAYLAVAAVHDKSVLVLAPYRVQTHDAEVYGALRNFLPDEYLNMKVSLYVAPQDGSGHYWLNRPADGARIDEHGNWQVACRFGDPDGVPMRKVPPLEFAIYAVATSAASPLPTDRDEKGEDRNYLEANGEKAFLGRLEGALDRMWISPRFLVSRDQPRTGNPLRFDAIYDGCGKVAEVASAHADVVFRACGPVRLRWTEHTPAVVQVNQEGRRVRADGSATWETEFDLPPHSSPYEFQLMRDEELSPGTAPAVLSSLWIQIEEPRGRTARFDSGKPPVQPSAP
jgi:hypothetical protein